MDFNVDFEDLLVPWTYFGGDDSKCVLGVLQAVETTATSSPTQWFLGTAFMDKYYTIFDNTNYTSDPNELPQMGFGIKDDNVVIFKNQYDNSPDNIANFNWQQGDQSYSTLSDGVIEYPVTIQPPTNSDVPWPLVVPAGTNAVPVAIHIPKPDEPDAPPSPDDGQTVFQKYKTYIFGITALLVLVLIAICIGCYCKKKNDYKTGHGLFSDEHVSLAKKYIN